MTDFASAKGEILNWMENEQQCVTSLRIAQTFGIPRQQASEWLRELATTQSDCQISTCEQVKEGNATGTFDVAN
jgi:hypothetical protein